MSYDPYATSHELRARIVAEARTWVGTPFVHQGRRKGEEGDCAGLINCVANVCGISDVRITGYSRDPDEKLMEAILDRYLDRVDRGEEKPGDIVWLRHPRPSSHPRHVAIYTGQTIIHIDAVYDKCIEHRFTPEWRAKVKRFYRYRGIDG